MRFWSNIDTKEEGKTISSSFCGLFNQNEVVMTKIGSNEGTLRANRYLSQQTNALDRNYERLSSGHRINHASDDAAGLAIAMGLLFNADTRSVGSRNLNDSISMAEIADGALSEAGDITTRMAELATQSANGVLNDDQRKVLNDEYQSLRKELDRISSTTEFNGRKLLESSNSTVIQAGVDGSTASRITMNLPGVSAASLGLPDNISSQAGARAAVDSTKNAVESITTSRGEIGTSVNRVQTALEGLLTSEVNERSAAGQIMDVDYAAESASLTANKIAQQSSAAISAQANIQADLALKLLS